MNQLSPEQRELVSSLTERLRSVSGIRAVALAGSHARGRARAESDIDLGLLYSESAPFSIQSVRELVQRHLEIVGGQVQAAREVPKVHRQDRRRAALDRGSGDDRHRLLPGERQAVDRAVVARATHGAVPAENVAVGTARAVQLPLDDVEFALEAGHDQLRHRGVLLEVPAELRHLRVTNGNPAARAVACSTSTWCASERSMSRETAT